MFPEYLPGGSVGEKGGGYESLGVAWEPGKETPVGFSKRVIGFPRVGINCALCHSGTYRTSKKQQVSTLVPGAPSQTFDALSYLRFLENCGNDPRFNADNLLAQMQYNVDLSALDKLLYRYLIIPQTKQALLVQAADNAWTKQNPRWGCGRIDPFNPVKYSILEQEVDGSIGNSDMQPLWELDRCCDEAFHWDGLNTDLREVVISSALGDGATPKSLPMKKLEALETYILGLTPPAYPWRDRLDSDDISKGKEVFKKNCAKCHADNGVRLHTVIPYKEIKTDRHRIDMWTQEAADTYNEYARCYSWDFDHFRAPDGYLAVHLKGIWL